jgi:hypothetical protein
MVTEKKTEHRIPFNLRGEDAEQFERLRLHHEQLLNTRLSAVQVARIVFGAAFKKIKTSMPSY